MTFLIIGGIGLALLILSLIFGDQAHGLFEGLGPDWITGTTLAALLVGLGFGGGLITQLLTAGGAGVFAAPAGIAGGSRRRLKRRTNGPERPRGFDV